jgi:hypothetical protein
MRTRRRDEGITQVASLQEYFRDSISEAMKRQGVSADDHTAFYVVNLLTLFSRSEALYEPADEYRGTRPLALMLAEAVDAASAEQRNFLLQRIGDISLFIAGFFGDGLARKLVDVDYYIRMGGSAYGSLSGHVRGTVRGRVFASVFAELASKFHEFVDVLADVREEYADHHDVDVLRLYELWLRTGSARIARLLRRCGIEPDRSLDAEMRH